MIRAPWQSVQGGPPPGAGRRDPVAVARIVQEDQDDFPVHQPAAPEAPIPGRHWYSGCSPDMGRVGPDGICRDCGERACPECGREGCDECWPEYAARIDAEADGPDLTSEDLHDTLKEDDHA